MKVTSGRLVSIPYTVELNDITIYAVQNHRSPELFERARDHFDRLYEEGAQSPRVMAISTHPYITGVPYRIKYSRERALPARRAPLMPCAVRLGYP